MMPPSEIHINTLIKKGIQGKRRAIDNIFIERLWRTVKYENVRLQEYLDEESLHKGLENYFKFYNNNCFHEFLDYNAPNKIYYKKEVA